MSDKLLTFIDLIKKKGKDPNRISVLLGEIIESKAVISRKEIIDFILTNKRLGYHTTPNDIAEFMAEIGRIFDPRSIIDISCGLANTLAFVDYSEDLTGIEIDSEIISLTKYLLPELNLILADSLKYEFARKYDLVISNFPYGIDIRESGQRLPIEALFIKKALEILKPGGTLVCLLPDTFLKIKLCERLREEILLNNSLEMVIQLPAGIIQNSYIIPAIVVIRREEQTGSVYLTNYSEKENIIENYTNKKGNFWILKENLRNNWDPQYHIPAKWNADKFLENSETVRLAEMAEVFLGCGFQTKQMKSEGEILYLRARNILKGSLNFFPDDKYVSLKDIPSDYNKAIIKPGDILVSRLFKPDAKVYIYKSTDPPAIASNIIFILRSSNSDYLATFLNTEGGRNILKEQIRRETEGHIAPVISGEGLRNMRIPIIPIGNLNQLGDRFIKIAEEDKLLELKDDLSTLIKEIEGQKRQNSETLEKLNLIVNRFNAIENQLNLVSEKLDSILSGIKSLSDRFNETRQLKRSADEIINRLYLLIDEKLDPLSSEAETRYEFYIQEIKQWLERWDSLEPGSKHFIPQAEFLYDQLARIKEADYSPFIVQYSRALENEILIKLFHAYHMHLISGNVDRNELTIYDIEIPSTQKFAKFIRADIRAYTLGDMNFILKLMKRGGKTLAGSRLLQDFKSFSTRYFEANVFEREFLDKITIIVDNYRNKAAHPNVLSNQIAQEFHNKIKECLSTLMDNYKTSANLN